MATFNLIRNSKVFFTTNVDATTGVFKQGTACTAADSFQLTVLDGFSFSQATNSDAISIAEAGGAANRGTRNFNTSLNPVDFSFSTYIRPYVSTTVKSDESVLWNALLNDQAVSVADVSLAYTGTLTGSCTVLGLLTLTATTITTTGLAVGDVTTLKGVVGAGASQYNAPVKVVSLGNTSTFQYLTAPAATFSAANFGATGVTKFTKSSWIEQAAVAADTPATAYSEANTGRSNLNQLQKFAIVITVDSVTYVIDNCVLDQATIDFGLDGIAQVQWTGKGAAIRQMATTSTYASPTGGTVGGAGGTIAVTGTANGTITASSSSTKYITNKLSTVTLATQIGGVAGTNGSVGYNLALTGGSITIANNVNYITPSNLGVVNVPIGYYTGNRQVSGSMTAYLRTGSTNTAGLFADMLSSAATSAETKYTLTLAIGGSNNAVKVELYGVGAALQIPTIDAQAVMSTTINFSLQGTDNQVGSSTAGYDLENSNDLRVRYFSS